MSGHAFFPQRNTRNAFGCKPFSAEEPDAGQSPTTVTGAGALHDAALPSIAATIADARSI